MSVEAVLFDVDFTICRPGPELRPEAYAERGREFGLELDPNLFEPTRRAALAELSGRLPDSVMRRMNAPVDVDRRSATEVARGFLNEWE